MVKGLLTSFPLQFFVHCATSKFSQIHPLTPLSLPWWMLWHLIIFIWVGRKLLFDFCQMCKCTKITARCYEWLKLTKTILGQNGWKGFLKCIMYTKLGTRNVLNWKNICELSTIESIGFYNHWGFYNLGVKKCLFVNEGKIWFCDIITVRIIFPAYHQLIPCVWRQWVPAQAKQRQLWKVLKTDNWKKKQKLGIIKDPYFHIERQNDSRIGDYRYL